ncbi:hypothetical protein ACKWMY_27955 [Serratia sp. J2]|uniref:hypothetical protein n=1 Tax=Serratia sp. J2 TaxID=3386551 RepID=UPI0039172A93
MAAIFKELILLKEPSAQTGYRITAIRLCATLPFQVGGGGGVCGALARGKPAGRHHPDYGDEHLGHAVARGATGLRSKVGPFGLSVDSKIKRERYHEFKKAKPAGDFLA